MRAARRVKSSRAAKKTIGTVAVPASADSDRSPASLVPKTLVQSQATA